MDIDRVRINERIRVSQVQLIDETGKRVGVKPTSEALKIAYEKELDLVEMVPNANPPVCKIIDFNKYRYEQEQKLKHDRKKSKVGQVKEIRFRPNISLHDLDVKINHIREFILEKYRVKITVQFSGREMQHNEKGYELFKIIKEKLFDIAEFTEQPNFERNRLITILGPKK